MNLFIVNSVAPISCSLSIDDMLLGNGKSFIDFSGDSIILAVICEIETKYLLFLFNY